MLAENKSRKIVTLLLIAALFAPYAMVVGFAPVEVRAAGTGTIMFDCYHGQFSSYINETYDRYLQGNLTALGYDVVWSNESFTSTVLADVDGLIIGAQYGEDKQFTTAEITAIGDWFNAGNKFLWIGNDADFGGMYYSIYNMTAILEACGSHVYPEQTDVEDAGSCCGAAYRTVANATGTDAYIADCVADVTHILMHGPTIVYGCTSGVANDSTAVALEATSVPNVYPLLYFGPGAVIADTDLIDPVAHATDATGPFVPCTAESYAGDAKTGVIVVSGADPYGDYAPMNAETYKNVTLSGHLFVKQTIDWAMNLAPTLTPPMDMLLIVGAVGAVIVVVIIIAVVMKKK